MTYTELWAISDLNEKKEFCTHGTVKIELEHAFMAYPTVVSSLEIRSWFSLGWLVKIGLLVWTLDISDTWCWCDFCLAIWRAYYPLILHIKIRSNFQNYLETPSSSDEVVTLVERSHIRAQNISMTCSWRSFFYCCELLGVDSWVE